MIPEIGVEILKQSMVTTTNKLGAKLVKARSFTGRSQLISSLVKFYSNISNLNNNPTTKPTFQKYNVGQGFLEFVTEILTKKSEANTVIPALRALREILDMKLDQEQKV